MGDSRAPQKPAPDASRARRSIARAYRGDPNKRLAVATDVVYGSKQPGSQIERVFLQGDERFTGLI
jgi:hypothetical protein